MNNNLKEQLRATLNCACAENASDTPDFILAAYLLGCLTAFSEAVRQRESWYGRGPVECSPPDDAR